MSVLIRMHFANFQLAIYILMSGLLFILFNWLTRSHLPGVYDIEKYFIFGLFEDIFELRQVVKR